MNAERKASIFVVASGVLWGLIAIFIKGLSAGGFSSLEISSVRLIGATVMFGIFILITDRNKLKIRPRDIWMFIGTGIVSVMLFNILSFYTMIQAGASISTVLLYSSPVFVMLMSAIFFKEKVTLNKILALILTVLGCALVSGVFGGTGKLTLLVCLTGLGSGFFYALYSIFGRVALSRYDSATVSFWTFACGAVASLFITDFRHVGNLLSAKPVLLIHCVGIVIISTILPYLLYTAGLVSIEPGKAAILVTIEPVVGSLLGICVYHEPLNWGKTLGICLVIAAIVLLNIKPREKN